MDKLYPALIAVILSLFGPVAFAQTKSPPKSAPATQHSPNNSAKQNLSPQQKFVLDVVQSAVALPQSDPQDRLRVLTSAANVIAPIRPVLAKRFAREGMRIEQDLILSGEAPAVSILDNGHVDCGSAPGFVENIPVEKVGAAEQSLIAAVSVCPKQALDPVQRKLDVALDQGYLAPRAMLAVIEQVGPKTPWAEQEFVKLFSSLPSKVETYRADSPNYAAMYGRMAPEVSKESAQKAGLKLLVWLGKMQEGGPRNLAINITTNSMKQALGDKAYEDALATDVMARQAAQAAGQPGDAERPQEESVSVLQALNNRGTDRTAELGKMPPSLRAREAAASGFASGTNGDRKQAGRYFDLAFSALDEVWSSRAERKDAPAVIEEVSEAAAQVDAVDALKRAQRLQDPSAQAIGMIAVARVVAGQQTNQAANQ